MKTKMLTMSALVLMMCAPVLEEQVYVDYNHSDDFTQYHTYAWGQGPNPNQIADSFLA